jgi:branched-chain amino acid transport system substrate-binding protein
MDKVKIGVAGTFSGPRSTYGNLLKKSIERASEPFNKNIEWVYVDDAACPNQSELVARNLVKHGVKAVIGHFNSECANRALKIYKENYIPLIAPASTTDNLTSKGDGWVFRLCPTDLQQCQKIIEFLRNKESKCSLLIYDDTKYGKELAETIMKLSQDLNIEREELRNVSEEKEYDIYDVVIFTGSHYKSAGFIKHLKCKQYKGLYIASDDSKVGEFIELVGRDTDSVYVIGGKEDYEQTSYLGAKIILMYYKSVKKNDFQNYMLYNSELNVVFNNSGERIGIDWLIWSIKDKRFIKE